MIYLSNIIIDSNGVMFDPPDDFQVNIGSVFKRFILKLILKIINVIIIFFSRNQLIP